MQPITENPAFKTLLQVLENHLNTLPLPLCEKDEHYWNFRQRNQKDVEYEFTSTADIPTDFDYGIVKRSEQLEICDLPYVRERLRLLGLEPHEPLMQTLWLQCNHNLDKMNYRSLWYLRYSDAVKTHTLSTRLLRILNAMMANPPQNLQELGIFSSILKRATPYLTDSHLEQCFPKLSEQGEILCAEATDPKLLYVLGKHLAYFFHHPLASSTNEQQMEAVLTTILDRSLELIDDVTTPNLRNIGQLAKKTGLFYSARRESLGQLAKPFLVDDLTLGRAVDLLFCFDQNFFPGELNEVYNLLDEMLDESKCAMTVTSFLIELAQTKLPASLTEHIHSFIVRNLDDNVNNVSFFQPVLFFVRNYPFEKAEHKDAFHHYLLSVLNTQPQLAMSDLMLQLFRVMVQVCEPHQLTDRLYDVVLKTIDCGKLGNRPDSLFAGLDGLSLLLTERYTLLPANVLSQQLKIKQLLFKELMTRLSDIPEFYMTYYLWPLLSSRALYDTNVINAVLQMYVTYTDVDQLRTMTRFNRIVHLFGKARYFSPEVCDNLTSFVVNHPKKVRLRDANKLVNHLADMSYKPKDFAAFCTLLWDKLDKLDHKYDGNFKRSYEVRILERLSQLQFFPEEMLSRVFSVEYLENLEIELEISYADGRDVTGRLTEKTVTERALKNLNIAVILECPQLGVPWFCEDLDCESVDKPGRKIVPLRHSRYARRLLYMELKRYLQNALGGSQYLRYAVTSQYGHIFDYECLLDENNRPIAYNEEHLHPNPQRVAFLILTPRDYGYNGGRMVGKMQQVCRHLQILDYKVVPLVHAEWFSMGSQSEEAKMDYLAGKIFGDRSDPL